MKVVILGLLYDLNYGDPLLFDCSRFLLNNCGGDNKGELEIEYMDFYGRTGFEQQITRYEDYTRIKNERKKKTVFRIILGKIKHIITEEAKNYDFLRKITINRDRESIRREIGYYYDSAFKDADLILVCGAGTLKYDVRLNFGPYYEVISEYADKHCVPCIISAAGVESKYNKLDTRCVEFANTLSKDVFKCITTRDDISELRKYVHNPNTLTAKLGDPGIWASKVYNIRHDVKSQIIGIGIINYKRFAEFHRDVSKERYFTIIREIVNILQMEDINFRFFTNGENGDTYCAYEIAEAIGLDLAKYVVIPKSPKELVDLISKFQAIITSRLHSCIISYSLNVPFVALAWNNKLGYFADNIGCPERIFESERFDSSLIIQEMKKAMMDGYDKKIREKLEESDITYYNEFLKKTKR